MDYRHLTDAERDEITRQKLHAIEVDHYRLTVDLDAAELVGITEGEQVDVVRANLAILERQHAELTGADEPPPAEEPPRAVDNGGAQRAVTHAR